MEKQPYVEFENFDFENNESFQNGWSTLANIVDANSIGVEYLRAKVFFFSKYIKPIDLEKYLSWKKSASTPCNQPTKSGDATPETHSHCPVEKPTGDHSIQTSGTSQCSSSTSYGDKCHSDTCGEKDGAKVESKENGIANTTISNLQSSQACDDILKELSSCSISQEAETIPQSGNPERETAHDSGDKKRSNCNKVQNIMEKVKDSSGSEDAESKEVVKEEEPSSLSFLEIASHLQNGIPIPGIVSLDVQPSNLDPTPSARSRKPKPWEVCDTKEADS